MKRIIEIPDKVVEAIQNGEDYRYDIHTAIAQSTPYNPSGDAISREALQGEYKTACNVLLSLEQIVRSSDGWEDSAVEAVHNAVQTAIKCMHDRPKGEWKANKYGEHFCPICGNYALYEEDQENDYYEVQSNFCPNCGVDMR